MYLNAVSVFAADQLLGLDIKLGNLKSLVQQASQSTTVSNGTRASDSRIVVGKGSSTLGRCIPLSNKRDPKSISEAVPDIRSHTISVSQTNRVGLVERVFGGVEQVATDLANVLNDCDIVPAAVVPKMCG